MEVILSALALFISVLMGMPTRAKDATDAKKARLGKKLADIAFKLDDVLHRAQIIISLIGQIPNTSNDAMKQEIFNSLLTLIDGQIEDLKNIGKDFQREFLWGFEYDEISGLDESKILGDHTDAYKILSIYEPDLGNQLTNILEYKSNLLVALSYVLKDEIIKLAQKSSTIREIRRISHELISNQFGKICFQEQLQDSVAKGLVEFQEINVLDRDSVSQYVFRAGQRLSEIQLAREKLSNFISKQFSPHELM